MSRTIERIDRSSPPGVSRRITSAAAPSARARSIAVETRRTVTGLMTPSISSVETVSAPAAVTSASPRAKPARTRPATDLPRPPRAIGVAA